MLGLGFGVLEFGVGGFNRVWGCELTPLGFKRKTPSAFIPRC